MNDGKSFKKREGRLPHIIAYVAITLTVLILSLSLYSFLKRSAAKMTIDFYYPFLKTAQAADNVIGEVMLFSQNRRKLASAAIMLHKENMALKTEVGLTRALQAENAELRSLLNIRRAGSFKPVYAQTLTRDPLTAGERFLLDKGTSSGIRPGNAVVVSMPVKGLPSGSLILAGRVKSASKNTAEVCTALSQEFKLGVTLAGSHQTGILEGTGSSDGTAVIRFLPVKGEITLNGHVLTNSLAGNAPPGIPVGEIIPFDDKSLASEKGHVSRTARMRPFIQPEFIRFAAVFTRELEE